MRPAWSGRSGPTRSSSPRTARPRSSGLRSKRTVRRSSWRPRRRQPHRPSAEKWWWRTSQPPARISKFKCRNHVPRPASTCRRDRPRPTARCDAAIPTCRRPHPFSSTTTRSSSCGGGQNARELLDALLQIVTLGLKFDAAHLGQSAQTQIQNVLRLDLVKIEDRDQPAFAASASSEVRITWITSSMSSMARSSPSTRCRRSRAFFLRYSLRRRITTRR